MASAFAFNLFLGYSHISLPITTVLVCDHSIIDVHSVSSVIKFNFYKTKSNTRSLSLFRYNLTFISSNSYIRHSLIGHLNLFANILLLGVLSFHRIVLHQLGLWDDFHFPMNDSSLIYQTNVTPSDTNRFRNEIIQNIYSMLKTQIENDKNLQTKNSNALHDDDNPSEQINLSFCSIKDLFSTIKNFYNYAIGIIKTISFSTKKICSSFSLSNCSKS